MLTMVNFFFHHRPAARTHLRGVSGIHRYGIAAGTFNLVAYHFNEFPPTSIVTAFVQTTFGRLPVRRKTTLFIWQRLAASGPIFNVQIFICNQAISIHKQSACFMQKIVALIFYFLMQCRKSFLSGVAFVLSIFRLKLFKSLFTFSKISWIFNWCPIGKNRKTFQAKINSYPGRNRLFGNRNVLIASENYVPLIPRFLNSARLYHPFNLPMQFHFQQSNFGNRYLVANNFKSGLRVANGMESFFPFEPWKAGSFTLLHSSKKMFERNVQSYKNILQNLRVNSIKFRGTLLLRMAIHFVGPCKK